MKDGKFRNFFFDIVTTHNDEICYVKHVLAPLCVFFTLFGCFFLGGGVPRGPGHNRLMQFSNLGNSKMESSKTVFFYIPTIQNDQISDVKRVLAPLYVFFALFGYWGGGGGAPKGTGHNLLMQFSNLGSSKMEISETDLFDTLTIQNNQISDVKHVLAPLYVFVTLFGCRGGGCSPRGWGTTCLCSFMASAAQKWSFLSPLRGALPKAI